MSEKTELDRFIRVLKLEDSEKLITNITYPKWVNYIPGNKHLNFCKEKGVLTGSFVLSRTTLNGKKLLKRTPGDFDFKLLRKDFMELARLTNTTYNEGSNYLTLNISKGFQFMSSNYSSNDGKAYHFFGICIHVIMVDSLSDYKESNGFKYEDPYSVMFTKHKLSCERNADWKHKEDLKYIQSVFES